MIVEDYQMAKRIANSKYNTRYYWSPSDELNQALGTFEQFPLLHGAIGIVSGTRSFDNRVRYAHHHCTAIFFSGSRPWRCKLCGSRTSPPNVFGEALDPLICDYVRHCLQVRGKLRCPDRTLNDVVTSLAMEYPPKCRNRVEIDWEDIIRGAKDIAVSLGYPEPEANKQAGLFGDQYFVRVVKPYLIFLETWQSRR